MSDYCRVPTDQLVSMIEHNRARAAKFRSQMQDCDLAWAAMSNEIVEHRTYLSGGIWDGNCYLRGIPAAQFVEEFKREHPDEWAAAQRRRGEGIEVEVVGE